MTHFDREIEHLVQREEHRDLEQHRQAARDRVDLLLLVERHDLLLLLGLVVLVLLLERLHLRLNRLHRRHAGKALLGDREHGPAHDDRQADDGDAEIADRVVDRAQQPQERLFEPAEPAPVDREAELLQPGILVAVEDHAFLGPGIEPRGDGVCLSRSQIARFVDHVGAIGFVAQRAEGGFGRGIVLRDERGEPVDVGKAGPAGAAFGRDPLVVVEIVVIDIVIGAVTEYADRARMRDPQILARGAAGAIDEAEWLNDDGGAAAIGNRLFGGDHELVVDRIADGEGQPFAIVMRQRDRRVGGQDIAIGFPQGLRAGNREVRTDPAELRELLRGCAARREDANRLAILAGGLVIALEHDVIDYPAAQVDRPSHARCVDRQPVRAGQRGLQIGHFLRAHRRIDEAAGARMPRCRPVGRLGALFARRIRPVPDQRLFGLRVEVVHRRGPSQQQQEGKHYGEDQIAMVVQGRSRLCPVESQNVGWCLSLSRQY